MVYLGAEHMRLHADEQRCACCAQKKPRKAQVRAEHRPLTQEELLEEAAQTELENSASVAALMAAEEEIRARAAVRKAKYCGPLLRYHSLKVAGEAVVRPSGCPHQF